MSTRRPNAAYGIDRDGDHLVVVRVARRRKNEPEVVLDTGGVPAELRAHPGTARMEAELAAADAVSVAALPASAGFARWLDTPFPSRGKAIRVLPSLLDLQLPFPLESCRYTFPLFASGPEGTVRAFALAARESELAALCEALAPAGLDPMAVEHEALGIWAAAAAPAEGTAAVLYLGRTRSTLVLGDGGFPRSVHGFRSGSLQLAGEDEVFTRWASRVHQVLRSQALAAGNPLPWTWIGPGADDPDLVRRLTAALPESVQARTLENPGQALPAGLARRVLDGSFEPSQLRNGPLEHPRLATRRRRHRARICAGGLAAGLLLAVVGTAGTAHLESRNRALQAQVTELAMDLTGLPAAAIPRGNEVFIVRQTRPETSASADPFLLAVRGGASRLLLPAVQHARPQAVNLGALVSAGDTLTVRGAAADAEACEAYRRALESAGIESTLELGAADGSEPIPFVLKGRPGDA